MNAVLRMHGLIVLLLTASYQLSVSLPAALAQNDEQAKHRLEQMQRTIASLRASSDRLAAGPKLSFADKPLLRYSDPTRDRSDASTLLDAGVWRLGQEGRPTALVTLEIYRSPDGSAVMSYEFASLAAEPFALTQAAPGKVAWKSTGSALEMKRLEEGPAAADSRPARLAQMRQLARQFRVRERLAGETVECRLLAQPIDRYEVPDNSVADSVDGALFVFANGTNPEAALLLEVQGKEWSYGLLRLGSAEISVLKGGQEVANFPPVDATLTEEGSYVSTSHSLKLPP